MPNIAELIRNRILAQHPGALLIERGERHVRHLLETLPDGRQHFATVSGPLLHYHDGSDWQEVNTDWLDSAETGFVDTVQAAGFTTHSDASGRRRLYPRRGVAGEYVEFARIQAWNGTGFVNIPWASKQRNGDTVTFDRANASLSIIHTGVGLKVNITLKDASAAARCRWPVSLVGLHRVGWQLVSDADGTVVATIRPPVITHAGGAPLAEPRPVQCAVVGGAVEFTADLSGLSYPIVIDPPIDVGVGASGDDTYRNQWGWSATTTAAKVGSLAGDTPLHTSQRFTGISGLSGATITTSYMTVKTGADAGAGTPLTKLSADDQQAAAAPTSAGTFDAITLTTAKVDWDTQFSSTQTEYQSPSLNTIIQELVDSYGANLTVIQIMHKNDGSAAGNNYQIYQHYDQSATFCPQLYIEYTTGGGAAINQSVNDVLQLNEAIARTLALRRFGADTIQLAESIKRAMALRRGIADTVTIAETTGKAVALRRLVAETVNVVEASRAARGLRRLVAETVTVGITELITNGGFEAAGAGGDDVWTNWIEDKQDGAIADETVITHSGGHAAKLTQGASLATDIRTINYDVVPDVIYTFQFWTRGDGTNAGRYGVYDVTHSAEIVTSTTTGIAGTTYALFTTTFTTPAGCTSIRFYLKPAAVNGAVAYFDDVSCINHAASWAALGLRRSVADIIGLAETTSSGIATSIVKAINEALQLAETSLRTLALSRPMAETVQVLETVIRPARWLRLVAETVTIAETTKAARALRRFASDVVQIVEATGRTLTQPGVITAIVKNTAETLQLIEARAVAKWPSGRLGIDIRRGYAIIRAVGRLYAAVVQGRQYRARHEK